MESLELRIFREVAYSGSFSKAAQNMGYVQSNITAHIKNLENELDTTLFIRHSKGISLTKDGEELLHQAEPIIRLLDNVVESFQKTTLSLKIGATQTITGYLLPQCIMEFKRKNADVSVSVVSSNQTEMEEQMIHGELDCIFSNDTHQFLRAQKIFEVKEDLMLITPISCKDLGSTRGLSVVVNNIESCPYRTTLLNWVSSHYSETPAITELDTVEAIIHMVGMGGGISLLPRHTVWNEQKVNQFSVPELQHTFISMWIPESRKASEYLDLENIIKEIIVHKKMC